MSMTQLLGCKPKWETLVGDLTLLPCTTTSQFRWNYLISLISLPLIFPTPESTADWRTSCPLWRWRISENWLAAWNPVITGCLFQPLHNISQCKTFWRATWVGLKFKHATWLPSVNLYFISLGCGPDSHLFENPVFDIVFKTGNTYFLKISKQRACNRTFSCPQYGRCPIRPGPSSPWCQAFCCSLSIAQVRDRTPHLPTILSGEFGG